MTKNGDGTIRYGLGIDAGGTSTDVVIHDFLTGSLVAKNKALTTRWRFSLGIDMALAGLPAESLSRVELVAVSTTLATNAIVEDEGQPTGLIVMTGCRPVRELFSHRPVAFIQGRLNMDGVEVEPIEPQQVRDVCRRMVEIDGVRGFAVSGFAGAINPQHELAVKRLIAEETGCIVCCGHELSDQLNLAVRAQTAVLNARIVPRMLQFFADLAETLAQHEVLAPTMVVKGDGTLMSVAIARERPIETILSGPAASVAGARYLTGAADGVVVDMGGTTTDTAEIVNGMVAVCEEGARVGRHQTHVRALKMRTSGLGGDSLIVSEQGQLQIGPRRVLPLVVAGAMAGEGFEQVLTELGERVARRPRLVFAQQVVMATGARPGFSLDEEEAKIIRRLALRPYILDELASEVGAVSHQFLRLARLENSGLLQRCGLTPTDILHVRGRLTLWPAGPARRWLDMLGRLIGKDWETLSDFLLEEVERRLARELFCKQLADEIDIEHLADCPLSGHLVDKLLATEKGPLALKVQIEQPIIGIGAPIGHFLPQAAARLGAASIIPENAEVANAIGAITSRIRLRRQLQIRPDDHGRFLVEGIHGGKVFTSPDLAEVWAVDYLRDTLRRKARAHGSSAEAVDFVVSDKMARIAGGQTLFLARTVQASLDGLPDLLFAGVATDVRP
ncbi:MAG: hydantoinase/oxoprolinase family protein [Desulfopila sp.]